LRTEAEQRERQREHAAMAESEHAQALSHEIAVAFAPRSRRWC
jgi:hypothetical protein